MLTKHRDLIALSLPVLLGLERAMLAEQFAATDRDGVDDAMRVRRHVVGLRKALTSLSHHESAGTAPATPGRLRHAASHSQGVGHGEVRVE